MLAFCALAVAIAACERVQLTPPATIENIRVLQTHQGLDVSFELFDDEGRSTVLMIGDGLIRIEDAASDTDLVMPGPLDSTRLLLNQRVYIDRTSFRRETVPGQYGPRDAHICRFGTFPYERLLRSPGGRFAVVRIAVVTADGERIVQAAHPIEWQPDVFHSATGTRNPRWK